MPIALLIIGILVVIAGVKNNASLLEQTLVSDFSGAGSFWYWIAAVLAIGSLGYYSPAKQVSHLFLVLIVLVFLLSNGGVFAQLQSAVQSPKPAAGNSTPQAANSNVSSGSGSGSDALSGDISSGNIPAIGQDLGNAARKSIGSILGGVGL